MDQREIYKVHMRHKLQEQETVPCGINGLKQALKDGQDFIDREVSSMNTVCVPREGPKQSEEN